MALTLTPCQWISEIDSTKCVGDGIDTINSNFANLQTAICDMYNLFPAGMIILYSGTVAPSGWAICDGTYVNTTTYSKLYSIVGTLYGSLSGGNFPLPDFRGRTVVGVNPAPLPGLSQRLLASTGGAETVALNASQNAPHTHTVTDPGHTHTAVADPHNHAVSDPGHAHTLNDLGHEHNVYYGIDPTTTGTGTLSAGSLQESHVPTGGQVTYGQANAVANTSVYQHQHSIGPFYNNDAGGVLDNTCPGTFWLSNTSGGTQLLGGSTGTGFYFASVAAKTTANPLQVTLNPAQSNVTLLAAPTNIAIENTVAVVTLDVADTGITVGNQGSGTAHENMPPWIAINYIIKLY